MKYLSKQNIITLIHERFIDESSDNDLDILGEIEAKNIALIKSYIGSRYNVDVIFDVEEPIKNELLISILTRLTIYDLIRRNAARKVPADYKENYDQAIKDLKEISTGAIKPSGLPLPTDENGKPIKSTSLWGNNSNKDFYI